MKLLTHCSRLNAFEFRPRSSRTGLSSGCGGLRQPWTQPPRVARAGTASALRASRIPLRVSAIRDAAGCFDEAVLRLPRRTRLQPEQMKSVFGYPRDMDGKYFMGKILGYGSFGVVRDCMEKESGDMYAVKTIKKVPKDLPPTPRYLLKLRAEVEIMQQIGSSLDTVNLKEVFEDDESIHLVMQLCEGGMLLERIREMVQKNLYSEKHIAGIISSVLRFISQCHAKGFIYRDVKPGNFLFLTNEPDSPLKATDFGLAVMHWPGEPRLKSRSGTPAYMAPELVLESYNEKCDLWSVGMLTYQLLTGRFPYWENVNKESLHNIFNAIGEGSPGLSEPDSRLLQAAVNPRTSTPFAPVLCVLSVRLQRFSTFSLLKQMVLKMEQSKANYAQKEIFIQAVKDLFSDIDTDESGGIQIQELQDGLHRHGHMFTDSKDLLSDMDTDESGGIQIQELQDGLRRHAYMLTDSRVDLFSEIDTDGSGGIKMQELQEGLRRHGYVLTDSEVVQLGRRPDLNVSGDIDLHELMTALIDWSKYLDRAFKKLDTDENGYISLEELYDQLEVSRVNSSREQKDLIKGAKLMLREADANGDGVICREEFNRLLTGGHAEDALSIYDTRLPSDQ
eukprot:gene26449-17548_t